MRPSLAAIAVRELIRHCCSDVTFYSIALTAADQQPGSTTIVAISSTTSHETTPKPKSLPQVAESMAMFWSGDLLDIAVGLSDDELANVEELKIRIKLPTPRILEFTTPKGFTSAHSKGGATITYTSNDEMTERTVSPSYRCVKDFD